MNTCVPWDGSCFWTPTCETRHGPFRAHPVDNGDAYRYVARDDELPPRSNLWRELLELKSPVCELAMELYLMLANRSKCRSFWCGLPNWFAHPSRRFKSFWVSYYVTRMNIYEVVSGGSRNLLKVFFCELPDLYSPVCTP